MMENNLVIVEDEDDEEVDMKPAYTIPDRKTSKARSTLPEVLGCGIVQAQSYIYAKRAIPYKTQFGPIDSELVSHFSLPSSAFLLKSKVKHSDTGSYSNEESYLFYNTWNEEVCNWLCLVRPADNFEQQNLMAHFVKDGVCFTTTREVMKNEELKVWYAPRYASFMGKPVLTPFSAENSPKEINTEAIYRRSGSTVLPNPDHFDDGNNLDVRSVPPKKRGWKRAVHHHLEKTTDKTDEFPSVQENHVDKSSEETLSLGLSGNNGPPSQNPTASTLTFRSPMFSCHVCNKLFTKKHTLKVHMTTHSSVYNFLCHACGKQFKRKDKLNDHIKRIHSASKSTKDSSSAEKNRFVPRVPAKEYEKFFYKCLRCSVGFIRRGMLVNHVLKQHPEIDVNSIPELSSPILKEDVLFSCLYCSKSYKSNSKRKKHILKHHPGCSLPLDIRSSKQREVELPGVYEDMAGNGDTGSQHEPNQHQAREKQRLVAPSPAKKISIENQSKLSLAVFICLASKGMVSFQPQSCPYCQSQYTSKSKLASHVNLKHKDRMQHFKSKLKSERSKKSKVNSNNSISIVSTPVAAAKPSAMPSLHRPAEEYSSSDHLITYWESNETGLFHSQTPVTISSQPLFMEGTQPHSATISTAQAPENQCFPSQIKTNFDPNQSDLSFMDEASTSVGQMDSRKDCGQSRLQGSYNPASIPFAEQAPSFHFLNDVPQSASMPTKILSQTKQQQHNKPNTAKKTYRNLPLKYSRGRKQLLIPFNSDRISSQQYESQQQSGKECSNYTIQITELNNTNETAQQESAISNSSEYSLLTSTPMHESTDNATVSITSIPYQDVNWMY